MSCYQIRVHKDVDRPETVANIVRCFGDCPHLLVLETQASRPHLQGVVVDFGISGEGLRNRLKKALDVVGNKEFSVAKWEYSHRTLRYFAKGDGVDKPPVVKSSCGMQFLPELIVKAHEEFWSENAKIQAAKKEKKKDNEGLYEQLSKWYTQEEEAMTQYSTLERRKKALEMIIDINHASGKLSRFQMKAYVDKVLSGAQDYKDTMVSEMLERW